MADINVEMLKEKLYPAAKALFIIGETLVDVSKQHISAEEAIEKIRTCMYDTDVICSRYRVNRLIEDCMEPIVSNVLDDKQVEWLKKTLQEYPIQTFEVNYPSCCDGCSNNPKNGGSGICNCTLPYMSNPVNYNGTPDVRNYMYYTTNATDLKSHNVNSDRISQAVERTQKYIKE